MGKAMIVCPRCFLVKTCKSQCKEFRKTGNKPGFKPAYKQKWKDCLSGKEYDRVVKKNPGEFVFETCSFFKKAEKETQKEMLEFLGYKESEIQKIW